MGCAHDAERDTRSVAEPLEDIGLDAAAVALAPETGGLSLDAIPLINAGVSAANGGSLGQDVLAGGEALAGQEIGGAIGLGTGNPAFNNTLGINDTPGGFGLSDIGGDINNALGSVGNSLGLDSGAADTAVGTNEAGAAVNASGGTVAAPASPTSVAPSAGSTIGAGQAGDFSAGQVNSQISDNLGDVPGASTSGATNLGTLGGAASNAIGATNTGSGLTGDFAQGVGGSPTLNSAGLDALSVPAASSAAAPASSSGGLLNTVENTAIKSALPVGALAYDAIKGPAKLPSSAQALEAGGAATAPLIALENQGATEASTGQLTAPQQANVLQYVQQSKDQLLQQLANEGVTNPKQDSRYIAGIQQIQQQALALQQQYITGAIQEATSAGGAASQNIATASQEQIQNDTAFQDALSQAFGALGGSVAGNVIRTAA